MVFHTIFVPAAFEATAGSVSDAAIRLAGAFDAHVMALHVRQRAAAYPPIDFYPSVGAASALVMESHDEATAAFARSMRAIFEERCDHADVRIVPLSEIAHRKGVTASWSEQTGLIAPAYSLAARVSDLVVTAMPEPKDGFLEREVLEEILLQSGAPVLLVPRYGLTDVPKRPLVAWDGSLQASRVVRGALPMLRGSEQTTLLTIGDTDEGTPGLEAAELWLQRSGVPVTRRTADRNGSIAECIREQAGAVDSDLIVMGGYSHSRLQESIFGGVTHHMLREAALPLLMIH
jgi:nucleotide-binding universal stress UspA family protein